MVFNKKSSYLFSFALFSILSLNFSVFAMKRQLPSDEGKSSENSLCITVTTPALPITMEETAPYFELVLIMQHHFLHLSIPKDLVKMVLSTTIEVHKMNASKKVLINPNLLKYSSCSPDTKYDAESSDTESDTDTEPDGPLAEACINWRNPYAHFDNVFGTNLASLNDSKWY